MKITGLQKLSLVDYDGHISCTVFTSGCNFACPFCHNSGLVTHLSDSFIATNEVMEHIIRRKGIIDSVVVSGGEPTLQPDLYDFIKDIKKLGVLVKLDTNGTNLEVLKKLIEDKLIDYVAIDIKNSPAKYNLTIDKTINLDNLKKTIDYVVNSGIDYEFRTTIVRELHDINDMDGIGKLIPNAKKYYLQRFVDSGDCIANELHDIPKEEITDYLTRIQKYIPNAKLRGY